MNAVNAVLSPQPFRARRVYRWLYDDLRLPRGWVHGALSAAKRATVRAEIRHRRRVGAELRALPPGPLDLDPVRALRLFGADEWPGAGAAAAYCRELFERGHTGQAARAALARNPKKRYLLSVLSGDEFHDHPELLRFMAGRPIVEAAARYLGTLPVLEGAALWWTPPNDSRSGSQLLHVDEEAPRQVKVILHCVDVTAAHGPLHALPADLSSRLCATDGRLGRLDDALLERGGGPTRPRAVLGPPGGGIVFDSSRCLHYGSRANRADRLVLTFQFVPLDTPTETRYHLSPPERLDSELRDLDPLQRRVLGLCGAP